jgi:hypothetical protein
MAGHAIQKTASVGVVLGIIMMVLIVLTGFMYYRRNLSSP